MKNTQTEYCTLYIVRHGETEWNVARRIQGHANSNLTKNGIQQAKELAKKFKSIKFDAAFSSDLIRAKRTAEILALEHKLVVETKEALRERFFGRMEGKYWKDHQHEMNYLFGEYVDAQEKALMEQKINKDLVNEVENSDALVSRFITFLREISMTHIGKTVLVVCHGGIMMHFLKHLGFMNNPRIGNTSYMKVQSDGVEFFIRDVEGIEEWK